MKTKVKFLNWLKVRYLRVHSWENQQKSLTFFADCFPVDREIESTYPDLLPATLIKALWRKQNIQIHFVFLDLNIGIWTL